MNRVLILGADGQLARNTTRMLPDRTDATLTLYLRRANRLKKLAPERVGIVEGDVLDAKEARQAMKGQDVAYASLACGMVKQAEAIIDAIHETGLKRLIFIAPWVSTARRRASNIEASMTRTVIPRRRSSVQTSTIRFCGRADSRKPPEGACRITQKGEPFIGYDIAFDISARIARIASEPDQCVRCSIGVSDG
jgi:NAD(P)H-binding